MELLNEKVIEQTNRWIKSVVINCNFCPFAAKAMFNKSIRYIVKSNVNMNESLESLKTELKELENKRDIETSFIIFENNFTNFNNYLELVKKSERLLAKENYDGVYQIASFHPDYCFDGSTEDDAANFTNRSIYPMLHILREDSLTKALKLFPNPEEIPVNNINYARQKGLQYMQLLRTSCL